MKTVTFSDVVTRCNTKEDRHNTDKLYYVGGEHISSNEMKVAERGVIEGSTIGPMFYCGFKPGDILFVTRNPHLRKCAVVDFEGICSEKTFVLETKDSSILLQEYLAIVMHSDDFWDYCDANKSGGVNYFVNWSTLAEYEFDLPPLPDQKRLAEKLWAAYEVKQSYLNMLSATDEMLKAQFLEMFGDQNTNNKNWNASLIKDEFELSMGKTPARANSEYWTDNGNKWISIADMAGYSKFTGNTTEFISDKAINECGIKAVEPNTVIMSFKLSIGRTAITSEKVYTNEAIMAFGGYDRNKFNLDFLYYAISQKNWLVNAKQAVKGATLNKDSIGRSTIIIPPIDLQNDFSAFLQQADLSKSALRKSIDSIDKVIKSLINENL